MQSWESFIDGGVDYTYAYHNVPLSALSTAAYGQNVSRVNAQAIFSSREGGLDYSAGLHYRHFGFYHLDYPSACAGLLDDAPYATVRQNTFGANVTTRLATADNSTLGLDIDADFLHTGRNLTPFFPYDEAYINGAATSGLISLTPRYDYTTPTLHATLGAQVDITTGDGKVFHIAPEVTLAWTPSQLIGFELKATGGSSLNSLAELYDITPYISSFMAYGQSHVPYAFDGRVTVGPMLGAYIEFFGGYAKADNWLMPTLSSSYPGGAVFDRADLSAWHAGAAIGYDYRDLASVKVNYETAPHSYDHSFFEWRDRARHVVNAELKVRPVRPLLVTLGWEFRAGRRFFAPTPADPDAASAVIPGQAAQPVAYTETPHSLGCVSNLTLGAGYTVTDPLTIFARGENLLNRRYFHLGDRYSQGINFMIGASLKF